MMSRRWWLALVLFLGLMIGLVDGYRLLHGSISSDVAVREAQALFTEDLETLECKPLLGSGEGSIQRSIRLPERLVYYDVELSAYCVTYSGQASGGNKLSIDINMTRVARSYRVFGDGGIIDTTMYNATVEREVKRRTV